MIYRCCDETRKASVAGNPALNGIDYVEVLGFDAVPLSLQPQTILMLRCLNKAPTGLTPNHVLISGGESITGLTATFITPANTATGSSDWPAWVTAAQESYFNALPHSDEILIIGTSAAGDFSPYTLRLVNSVTQAKEDPFELTEVLNGFDPQLAEVEFYFKVECPPFFDCQPPLPDCPPDLPPPPSINYLAKDYGSFRTVMLDRLRQLVPGWNPATEADLGVALAELIAYVGDRLSYKQDAVVTEAYLNSARSRVSLRRHARLVDYHVHDGCNARTWMQLQVASKVDLKLGTRFYTSVSAMPQPLNGNERAALDLGVVIFETMQQASLFPEHGEMSFYTWGDKSCCLPKGATEATLLGNFPNMQVGDVLIFQEMVGPRTGNPADADVRHRCAVRLTNVIATDASGNKLKDPLNGQEITEIQWSSDDALRLPICISSTYLDATQTKKPLTDVSKVFGNVVLADHGVTLSDIVLGVVPQPTIFLPPSSSADRCNPQPPVPIPVRYQPALPNSPVTQAVPLSLAGSPVTPEIVHLIATTSVMLTDASGLAVLTVQPANLLSWPDQFGIVAQQNTSKPANFDLSVLYNPVGGAPGMSAPPIIEKITDLSLASSDPNFVVTKVNAQSRFLHVPSPPPGAAPAGFPTSPTQLSSSGTTDLKDTGGTTYVTLGPTNPVGWPASFGVLTQDLISDPTSFNLLLVYAPVSGGVGLPTPVVVEQFPGIDLSSPVGSKLVNVRSFENEPNIKFSAYDLMHYDANQAIPVITLASVLDTDKKSWSAEQDLLADGPSDTHFVVEIESDGTALLRFGDNVNGLRPDPGTNFTASYRIGNGTAGDVGADTLLNCDNPSVVKCTNPLPAVGGTNPETADQIRRRAPQAFMIQERAVTMADYERVAEMNSQVENAVATLRWTGSWYTAFVTAEPKGAGNLTSTLKKDLKQTLNRYRLAGQDIELESPQYVSLRIALTVCVDPAYFQSDVTKALIEVLGCGTLRDGTIGIFYPDNFTFGQTVYLSRVYAAARKVPGVRSVVATIFQPQASPPTSLFLSEGEIPLGPFQIARLENDPSLPDHGQLTLTMQGGK